MPQTLLLSTTDRNCRPTWHKFQPQGGKEYTIHSTHTQYTHFKFCGRIFSQWAPIIRKSPIPLPATQSLIYISTYHYYRPEHDRAGLRGICQSCRTIFWCSCQRRLMLSASRQGWNEKPNFILNSQSWLRWKRRAQMGLSSKIRLGKRKSNFRCCGYGSWSVCPNFLLVDERIRIR